MKHERDTENVIKTFFDKVIEKYSEDFQFVVENARFIFTFRDKPIYDEEGEMVAAFAKSVNNRERDIYGTDFEICVYQDVWDQLSNKEKERLVFHEMLHCRVVEDEDAEGTPVYDGDGRVSIYIEPHDVVIKTFKREIEQFGLIGSDVGTARFLALQYQKKVKKAKGEK